MTAYEIARDLWSRDIKSFSGLASCGQEYYKLTYGENIENEVNKEYEENHERWDSEMETYFKMKGY